MATLNLQVGVGGDDGLTFYDPPNTNPGDPDGFDSAGDFTVTGCSTIGTGTSYNTYFHFTGVSGLSGATIDGATIDVWGFAADQGTPETLIAADDQASPAAPTTAGDHDGRTRTGTKVTWDDCNLSASAFVTSPEIKTVIQELANSYDPSTILILWDDDLKTNSLNRSFPATYDGITAEAAKLDIDYTGAGVTTRRYSLPLTGVG